MFRGYCARLGDANNMAGEGTGGTRPGDASYNSTLIVVDPPNDEVIAATRADLQDLITVAYSWIVGEIAISIELANEVETFVMEATMMMTDSVDRLIVQASTESELAVARVCSRGRTRKRLSRRRTLWTSFRKTMRAMATVLSLLWIKSTISFKCG